MSWTYLSSAPGSSDLSWVRAQINDTSSANALLQDEEINLFLGDAANKYEAAARCARALGASFSRNALKQVGKLKMSMAEASEFYFNLAKSLDNDSSKFSGGAWAGGVSNSDKEIQTSDPDWAGASFTRNQFDF